MTAHSWTSSAHCTTQILPNHRCMTSHCTHQRPHAFTPSAATKACSNYVSAKRSRSISMWCPNTNYQSHTHEWRYAHGVLTSKCCGTMTRSVCTMALMSVASTMSLKVSGMSLSAHSSHTCTFCMTRSRVSTSKPWKSCRPMSSHLMSHRELSSLILLNENLRTTWDDHRAALSWSARRTTVLVCMRFTQKSKSVMWNTTESTSWTKVPSWSHSAEV